MVKYYFTTKKRKPLPNGEKWTSNNIIEVIADEYKEAAEYVKQTFGDFDGGYTESCAYLFFGVCVYSVDISSKKALIELREKYEQLEAERDMLKRCLEIAEKTLQHESAFDDTNNIGYSLSEISAIKQSFYPF